jgi:hypothetical protein
MVLLMVSLELGFVPAICGMAAMLAVIPLQVGACVLWQLCSIYGVKLLLHTNPGTMQWYMECDDCRRVSQVVHGCSAGRGR